MLCVVDIPKLYSSVKHSKTNVQPPWGMVQGLRISFDVDIKPWWLSDPESFSRGTNVTRKGIYMLPHSFEPEFQLLLL